MSLANPATLAFGLLAFLSFALAIRLFRMLKLRVLSGSNETKNIRGMAYLSLISGTFFAGVAITVAILPVMYPSP